MPLLEDLLLRFRRVWAPPGPVQGQAGVPVDLERSLDDELRELTVALSAIDLEGEAIVQAAESEAAAIIAVARAESVRAVDVARARVPDVRAGKAAARIQEREEGVIALIAKAERDASEMRSRARSRMEPLVDRVKADVLGEVASSVEEQHARVMGGG
jgi:hypothetical protein